ADVVVIKRIGVGEHDLGAARRVGDEHRTARAVDAVQRNRLRQKSSLARGREQEKGRESEPFRADFPARLLFRLGHGLTARSLAAREKEIGSRSGPSSWSCPFRRTSTRFASDSTSAAVCVVNSTARPSSTRRFARSWKIASARGSRFAEGSSKR